MLKPIVRFGLICPLFLMNSAIAHLQPSPQILAQNTVEECNPALPQCPHRGPFDWSDAPIPYVVSPRRTRLRLSRPLLLRWLPIAEATTYTVTLVGENLNWTAQTPDTQLLYTGEQPLEPGGEYKLIVEADTGASSLDEPFHPGDTSFVMLTVAEQTQVAARIAEIRDRLPDRIEQERAIAKLYLEFGLIAEGIEQLQALHVTEPSPTTLLQLGDLHFERLLLPTVAKPNYEGALFLSSEMDETKAIALTQLGHVHAVMHQPEAAIAAWQGAQRIYQELGDFAQLQRLEELIQAEQLSKAEG